LVNVAELFIPRRDVVCALLVLLFHNRVWVLVVVFQIINNFLENETSNVGERNGSI